MQALGPERFIRRPAAGSNNIVISVCVLCQRMVAATDSLELLVAIEHLHICPDAKKMVLPQGAGRHLSRRQG